MSRKKGFVLFFILLFLISLFLLFLRFTIGSTNTNKVENTPSVDANIVLSERLPYAQDTFSVVSDYSDGHYIFLVEISEGVTLDVGKADFLNWAKSLGLSESVIHSLDIEYLEPSR